MKPWSFLAYVTHDRRNLVEEWRAGQDPAVQAAFDMTLATLRGVDDWSDPDVEEFKVFERQHVGLAELRFHVWVRNPVNKREFKRRFRVPGIWRPERRDFIILLGLEKIGRQEIPHGACDAAMEYKALFEGGAGGVREYF